MFKSISSRQTSCVTRHTSHATRHTPHVTRHTPHVTRHTSHVTRHTSYVTRHTSHVTRHTSHITRHPSQHCGLALELADELINVLHLATSLAHLAKCHKNAPLECMRRTGGSSTDVMLRFVLMSTLRSEAKVKSSTFVLSHVTRHTSNVTRQTSHVKRHTSHVTRHSPAGVIVSSGFFLAFMMLGRVAYLREVVRG
jgi:hypothetical protein